MNTDHSAVQFLAGLQHVERALRDEAQAAGITIDDRNFHYRHRTLVPPPKGLVRLEITYDERTIEAPLSFEMAEDSWNGLGPEARAWVRSIVAELAA